MKFVRLSFLSFLLISSILCSLKVYQSEREKVILKADLIEVSKIQYGLFNVDEWKLILADIITKKVEEFDLDDTNREQMRVKISNFLTTTINDFESRFHNEKSKSFRGIIERGIASVTGTFRHIKADIPIFTEQILDFLNEKENRTAIRSYFIHKLNEYADNTFSATDYSAVSDILGKYEQEEIGTTKSHLKSAILELDANNQFYKLLLVLVALLTLGMIVFLKKVTVYELILSLTISLGYLVLGILLPMIEIDARIAEITFHLLGEKIIFSDQVLFFKSKSIMEVVHLMMIQNRIDLIAVGILVFTFSVLFPLSKLVSSWIFLQNKSSRKNPVISFMVLKSGKWSMADVMVLAIFMAYIGFDGIISEQLKQISDLSNNLDLLTTNKSNLNFGFYLFTLFVLLSLFIAQKIQGITSQGQAL